MKHIFAALSFVFIASTAQEGESSPLQQIAVITGAYTETVAIADLDNDGDQDIVAGSNGGLVHRLLNDGTGTSFPVASSQSLSSLLGTAACPVTPVAYFTDMAVGNFDGDVYPDLVVISVAAIGQSAIFRLKGGLAGYTCAQVITNGVGSTSAALATGDVDADGRDDVFWTSSGTGISIDKVRGLMWNSQGLAKERVLVNGTKPCNQGPSSPGYRTLELRNLNIPNRLHPTALDLVTTGMNWRSVTVWEGKNNGTFQPPIHHRNQLCNEDPAIAFNHTPSIGTAFDVLHPSYLFTGYITANRNNLVSMRESHGSSGEDIINIGHQTVLDTANARDGVLADWNNDGVEDWLIVGGNFNLNDGWLHVVYGANNFYPFLEERLVGGFPSAGMHVGAADLNMDGQADLVVGGVYPNGILVYLNP